MYPGKALYMMPSTIRFPIRYSVPSPEGNASGRGDAESDILIKDQRDAGLKQKYSVYCTVKPYTYWRLQNSTDYP